MAQAGREQGMRLVLALVVVLVVAAIALAAVLLVRGGGGDVVAIDDATPTPSASADSSEETPEAVAPTEPCPVSASSLPTPTTTPYSEQPTVDLGDAEVVRATLRTTCGEVVVVLDAEGAPSTVGNFVALAEDGYFDGVGFHRVIDGFMIQGGDPTGTGTGCVDAACATQLPGYTFADELGPARRVVEENGGYPRGTLAMANRGADTNGSQFFIVQASPAYPLPPQYAVFGSVESGMEVVDRIALGPVDGQLAVDPVVILGVDVER